MPAILSVGHDLVLLKTRESLLQQTGAEITSVHPSKAAAALASGEFKLAVLCHTLSEREVNAIADAVCETGSRVLLMRKDADLFRADRWEVCGTHQPAVLLKIVRHLLDDPSDFLLDVERNARP